MQIRSTTISPPPSPPRTLATVAMLVLVLALALVILLSVAPAATATTIATPAPSLELLDSDELPTPNGYGTQVCGAIGTPLSSAVGSTGAIYITEYTQRPEPNMAVSRISAWDPTSEGQILNTALLDNTTAFGVTLVPPTTGVILSDTLYVMPYQRVFNNSLYPSYGVYPIQLGGYYLRPILFDNVIDPATHVSFSNPAWWAQPSSSSSSSNATIVHMGVIAFFPDNTTFSFVSWTLSSDPSQQPTPTLLPLSGVGWVPATPNSMMLTFNSTGYAYLTVVESETRICIIPPASNVASSCIEYLNVATSVVVGSSGLFYMVDTGPRLNALAADLNSIVRSVSLQTLTTNVITWDTTVDQLLVVSSSKGAPSTVYTHYDANLNIVGAAAQLDEMSLTAAQSVAFDLDTGLIVVLDAPSQSLVAVSPFYTTSAHYVGPADSLATYSDGSVYLTRGLNISQLDPSYSKVTNTWSLVNSNFQNTSVTQLSFGVGGTFVLSSSYDDRFTAIMFGRDGKTVGGVVTWPTESPSAAGHPSMPRTLFSTSIGSTSLVNCQSNCTLNQTPVLSYGEALGTYTTVAINSLFVAQASLMVVFDASDGSNLTPQTVYVHDFDPSIQYMAIDRDGNVAIASDAYVELMRVVPCPLGSFCEQTALFEAKCPIGYFCPPQYEFVPVIVQCRAECRCDSMGLYEQCAGSGTAFALYGWLAVGGGGALLLALVALVAAERRRKRRLMMNRAGAESAYTNESLTESTPSRAARAPLLP